MKYLILIALLYASVSAKAQKAISDTIYWQALDKFTIAIDTFYSKHSDNKEWVNSKIVYIEKPSFIKNLPSYVNGYTIALITPSNKQKLYFEHKNQLVQIRIARVVKEKDLLKVSITPQFGTVEKNGKYRLGVADGTTVLFSYKSDRFYVDKVINWSTF